MMPRSITLPLSRSLLNDPAFSPDPRTHPHCPLADVTSFKPPPPPPPTRPALAPRKTRMKALVRRLTTRHNLDRIDELDESDPFGGGYHHDGPYEALATSLDHPTLPPGSCAKRQFDSFASHLGLRQYTSPVPLTLGETGLSLHLEPGQILQQNTIYTSHIALVPTQFHQSHPFIQPEHSSLLNRWPQSPKRNPSLNPPNTLQNRSPLSINAPRECRPIDKPSNATIIPPPRHESRLYSPGLPLPPSNSRSLKTQSLDGAVSSPPLHGSRHKSVHSLDISYTLKIAQSSNTRDKPRELERIRHLPKRLVMPTLLQPQPPLPPQQQQFPTAWKDTLEGPHSEGEPAVYIQKPRLLRKKSFAIPAKTHLLDHVTMSPDDGTPIRGNSPTKTTNEERGTKERTRRRRLSKRKDEIDI